jgi:hypothetical protein
VIAMVFFQREVLGWLRGVGPEILNTPSSRKNNPNGSRRGLPTSPADLVVPTFAELEDETPPIPPVRTHVYTHVHELLEEMKTIYASMEGGVLDKAEVLRKVATTLKKFTAIAGTPFQAAVNHNIAGELQRNKLSVTYEDIAACW